MIHKLIRILKTFILTPYRALRYTYGCCRFGSYGWYTSVRKPLLLQNTKRIYLEDEVRIGKYSWLAASKLITDDSKLIIKKGSTIGDFSHIYASKEIVIEENVLLANFVYISDNSHGYEDIHTPIIHQNIIQKNTVHIGEGSWIGEHVCVIGANIGKHCVIGANSVVTKDIPDFCIAVGAPAKVVKKYNNEKRSWDKII